MAKKIKAGVIGLGVGEVHAKGYLACPDAELIAVCDANPERLKASGDRLGLSPKQCFTDVEKFLALRDLEAVSVTVPNHLHAPLSIAALQAGKHVLCEKPLARTAAEAQSIVEAAKAAGRILMVGFNYRFREDARWVKSLETEGKLGRVYFAKAGWMRNRGIPGLGTWFTQKSQSGGGPLIDLGVHVLDLTLWLMGYPRVVSVSGATFAEFGPRGLKGWEGWRGATGGLFDVEDLAAGFVRFENGAVLLLETNWASHTKAGRDDYFVTLYGTEGGTELYVPNYADHDTVTYFTELNGAAVDVRPPIKTRSSGHALAVNHFVQCVLEGREPEASGEQGVALLRLIDALYESARTGGEVRLG